MSITMDDSTKDYIPKDYLTYTIEEIPFEDTVTKVYPKDKKLTIRMPDHNREWEVFVPSIWTAKTKRCCGNCEFNDGNIYTSIPVKYKCSIDNEFHFGDYECDKEFAPVRHGHWISHGSYFTCSVCGEEQYGVDTGRYYCQNCGAKMEEEK